MKIFDTECNGCRAIYKIAEAESLQGTTSHLRCQVCGAAINQGRTSQARVAKLIVPPERKVSRPGQEASYDHHKTLRVSCCG